MKVYDLLYVLFLITLAANASAAVLYEQVSDPNINNTGAITSYDPLPIAADDFTPSGNWLLTGATFRGDWTTGSGADPTSASRTSEFNFYADANGPIDPPIISFTADASLSLAGIAHASNLDSSVYDMAVDFPAAVSVNSGITYWFSVVDEGPGRNGADGFFWIISPEGNGVVASKDDNGWTVYHQNQDFAPHDLVFSLIGSAVPEPSSITLSTIALVVTGLIGFKNSQD